MDLLTIAASGAGALAGATAIVYFAFAGQILPRLDRAQPSAAIREMQKLNREVERAPFFIAFFGAAVCSIATIILGVQTTPLLHLVLAVVGGVSYLVGVSITIAWNVPRNRALARLNPTAPGSALAWRAYSREWGAANWTRAICSTITTVTLFALAILAVS
ncbi:DUF1772 domain-containing protein [Humidisolicoccus flavus]|uniref:anthrone oxygenase family protein n=1 Tax=Humidisolicoccus flavus TaxID=3111414 RepID=UPI003249F200